MHLWIFRYWITGIKADGNGVRYGFFYDLLASLDEETLKIRLLEFLYLEDIEVDSMEDFRNKFIDYIE